MSEACLKLCLGFVFVCLSCPTHEHGHGHDCPRKFFNGMKRVWRHWRSVSPQTRCEEEISRIKYWSTAAQRISDMIWPFQSQLKQQTNQINQQIWPLNIYITDLIPLNQPCGVRNDLHDQQVWNNVYKTPFAHSHPVNVRKGALCSVLWNNGMQQNTLLPRAELVANSLGQ